MKALSKIAVVIAIVILVSVSIFLNAWHLIPLFLATIFAFTAPFIKNDSEIDGATKSRLKCLYLSFLPGLGHVYLGRVRSSIPYITVFAVSIFVLLLMISFAEDAPYLILLFGFTYFADAMIATINAESICDELNLPHESSAEMNIKNRPRAYLISIIVPYILVIIVALCCWIMDMMYNRSIYCISLLLWTAAAIYSFFRYYSKKSYNVIKE